MVTYGAIQALIKLSISLLLLRLMANRWQKLVIQACICITILASLMITGYAAGFCIPARSFWLRDWDKCDVNGFATALEVHGAVNLATDVALAGMPAIVLARSNLPRKQKIATGTILAIGTGFVIFICTCFLDLGTDAVVALDWQLCSVWSSCTASRTSTTSYVSIRPSI